MKTGMTSFFVGFLFAIGLGVSGMTQPSKVVGFLDLFGNWDPSLMFVMIGAIGVHFFAYRWVQGKDRPLIAEKWSVPNSKDLTPSLMIGAVLFGMGWALAGYCPGPAIASFGSFDSRVLIFIVSMVLGMLSFRAANTFFSFRK